MLELLHFVWHTFKSEFISPEGNFFWGWMIIYATVAISLGKSVANVFPKKIFWTRSAKIDYLFFFVSDFLVFYPLIFFFLSRKSQTMEWVAFHIEKIFLNLGIRPLPIANGFWVDLIYTFCLLVAADFGWTVQHILFHRVKWLWEIHKAHHSATELNLVTVARLHPLELFIQAWTIAICTGVFVGLVKITCGYLPSIVLFMNVSVALAAYRSFGILRHSHLWLTFSKPLSYFVASPAMHHIHHSIDEKHHNKNFSNVFSFWDFVFGTLYIPKKKEKLKFGIPKSASPHRTYDSFLKLLFHPFIPESVLNHFYSREKKKRHLQSSRKRKVS